MKKKKKMNLRRVTNLADSHNILHGWKNCFSQLLNVHKVSDFRQIRRYKAESLVPDPSPFYIEIAIAKLKQYKLPGIDKIPAEVAQAGDEHIICLPLHEDGNRSSFQNIVLFSV
jgi:hypothetical protein